MSTSCFFYISCTLSFTHSTFFLPVSVTFSQVNGFSFIVIFFVDWLTALQTMNEIYTFANEDKGKGIYKILYKCFSSLFQVAFPKCRQINVQKKRRKSIRRKKNCEQETLQKKLISMAGNNAKKREEKKENRLNYNCWRILRRSDDKYVVMQSTFAHNAWIANSTSSFLSPNHFRFAFLPCTKTLCRVLHVHRTVDQ